MRNWKQRLRSQNKNQERVRDTHRGRKGDQTEVKRDGGEGEVKGWKEGNQRNRKERVNRGKE